MPTVTVESDRVDTAALLARVDFRELLVQELGPCDRAGNWRCPFHDDHGPSFGLIRKNTRKAHCFACGWSGDALKFTMARHGLPFRAACERLAGGAVPTRPGRPLPRPPESPTLQPSRPPSAAWAAAARAFCDRCATALWSPAGRAGLEYLLHRGFTAETIRAAGLGWHPEDERLPAAAWGLPDDHNELWLPAGVVMPWDIGGEVWRVNVRRLAAGDGPKYIGPAGAGSGLYRADAVQHGHPVVLVEGEFDALAVHQRAGDLVAAVATGSASGARVERWRIRLSTASRVLLAFDRDAAGEEAAQWWAARLPNATRLRPEAKDPGDMGDAVRGWVLQALHIWTADQRHSFEERAGILEHDAGLPRQEAERRAR
jgi:DNA primase